MIDQCGRTVSVDVSVNAGAVSDINIFKISKMCLIKIADFPENTAPVNCSTGTCGKDFIRFCVIGGRPSAAPADSPPWDRDKNRVFMTGPAEVVFDGEWNPEKLT